MCLCWTFVCSLSGLECGDLEAQKQADDEEKEKTETQRSSNEEEMKERSDESTIHTVPELLMDTQKVCCFTPEIHYLSEVWGQ